MRTLWCGAWLIAILVASTLHAQAHPGNIFLAGEEVSVKLPTGGAWQLCDETGKVLKQGEGATASLGQLGLGYYELRQEKTRTTLGVIAPLKAKTSRTSPIGVDVAMAWFYPERQMDDVARLCRLAGINWVRDRLAWGEIEPRRGEFASNTRYDASAKAQSSQGLQVLQVNHSSPGWATREPKRFPQDLRIVHDTYRALAQRWKGQVSAFEPWNEADIDMFGGHTGSEMAALQKAAYLGLKQGNPDILVCLNVFAEQKPGQLEDLAANETWPYFDTCNLHHYIGIEKFPARYAAFRAISAGRPLWTTEFSMPVQWADEKSKEPSDNDLRIQAERVPVAFAGALHEGVSVAFYFLLPDYTEGKTQFGIIHKDLTPRPAYIALANLGRLLSDARPLGRIAGSDAGLHAYCFAATPDGEAATVIVAWNWQKPTELSLPVAGRVLDVYGRTVAEQTNRISVTGRPVYIILPAGGEKGLQLQAPVPMPPRQQAKPSPLVLQAVWPTAKVDLKQSAYKMGTEATVPLAAYNFSDQPMRISLQAKAPEQVTVRVAQTLEIPPGGRLESPITLSKSGDKLGIITIRAEGDARAILSFRVE